MRKIPSTRVIRDESGTRTVTQIGNQLLLTHGENNYIVVEGDKVVRRGEFACAAEAMIELKPIPPEKVFIAVGGQ